MDVRLPDGTIIRNVPDGTTREQLTAKLKANGYTFDEPKPEPSTTQKIAGGVRDAAAGLVRGAGSIGATILAPIDIVSDAIDGKGLTLESNRQRRQDMDSALADLTGADTSSLAYQGGKLVTEVAGTMGAGGAIANGATRLAPAAVKAAPQFNAAMNALRSGGMSTGVRPAAGFVPKATDLAIRSGAGAVAGGASAGLVNPEDAALGLAVGGALPPVVKTLGAGAHTIGRAVSGKAAKTAATNKLAEMLGDDVGNAIADIQTYYPKGAEDIPVSSAAILNRNANIARLEQGSRLNSSPAWYDFDQRQGKAVFDNVMKATDEAGELGARKAARADNWTQAWAKAEESQKPRLWVKRMTEFGANLEQAMRSPQSSNPEVRAVLEAINNEFDRVGPAFSPAHLQQIRANLNGKIQPMSGNVFKSAPRDNPAIISIKQELDDILNTSTGGKWQKVIEGYAQDSQKVHASAAAAKVRESFVDGATGRVRGTSLDPAGDIPRVTEAGIGRAMDAARLPDKSLALSQEANARLTATLDALRRQNVVQGVKRSATAGGGSDTVSNALASGAANAAGAPNMLLQLLGAVKKMGTAKTDNELALLLSNPDELARVLSAWQQPVAPNRLGAVGFRAAPALTADR